MERGGVGSWGEWAGGGGLYFPLEHRQQCCVSSISERNRHSPQDKQRQLLAAVWQNTCSY